MTEMSPGDYATLLREVKERVRLGQYAALRAVNQEMVALYWDIGHLIVYRLTGEAWGKSVVQRLAADLQREFPGVSGFSASNLWRMKLFYETYSALEKLAPMVREVGWSHNLIIMERCSDPLEREFYLPMTAKFGWTKNVLIHQIENQSYEKTLLGQTNFDHTLLPEIRAQAKLAIKDEYTFDFLEMGEEHSERELERALIALSLLPGPSWQLCNRSLHNCQAKWRTRLEESLPKRLQGRLPAPEEIIKLLEGAS